jgi:hypothetical protein
MRRLAFPAPPWEITNVRTRFCWLMMCLLSAGLAASCGIAQEAGIAAKHHPWGRFQPGAWKLVRVLTETLDTRGFIVSTSVTETKTCLVNIENDGVVLEVEVGIEVAGKQFDGQPQCIKQGFHGEPVGPGTNVKAPVPDQIVIEDRRMPCQIQEVECLGSSSKTVTKVYYTDTCAPYILKRQSATTDSDGGNVLGEMSAEVIALDMPYRVLSEVKSTACVKTVQKHTKGTITTVALTCPQVPGGVVYHTSKETDKSGQLVRRSTLELVAYGLQPEEERIGLFGRKRPARGRKPALHSAR